MQSNPERLQQPGKGSSCAVEMHLEQITVIVIIMIIIILITTVTIVIIIILIIIVMRHAPDAQRLPEIKAASSH